MTSGTATVTDNGDNTFTVSTSADCTVQINFEAIPITTTTNLYIKADSAPYVYTWTGSGNSAVKYTGDWPGSQATETVTAHGITWYHVAVEASGFNLILNTGSGGTQTPDIEGITGDKYIVWNADGLSAAQYLFVDDYASVTATDVTVGEGSTASSSITSTPAGLNFSYSSDNTSVATVANDGTVTGVSQGSATITVSWNAQTVNNLGYPGGSTTFTVNVTEVATTRTYVKVTSTDEIEDGKKYLIVYEGGNIAFDGSLSTLNETGNKKSVTISDNTITTSESIYFTINGGTIRSASGKYIGRTSDSNGMDENATTTYTNTISIDNNGDVNIVGSGGAHLRYNNSNDVFRYYKSSTYTGQKAIQLYKEGTVTHEVNLYIKADSAPYVYTWTGSGNSATKYTGDWPGTQTTETVTEHGVTWHKITVPAKGFNLILNTGSGGTQTSDIVGITKDKYIVWNSAADGYAADQYLFVDFATVSASDISVRVDKTAASNVTTTPQDLALIYTYQSSDPNVATVASDGTVTGVAEGTATITVSWATQVVDTQGYLGGSTTFTVTVTPASTSSDVFVKATSESELLDGMQIIIVNDTYNNVMGEQSDNNFGVASVEIDKTTSPYEATPGNGATILTLEGSSGAWYFKDEHDKYLYAASNSSNLLKTQTEKNDNAKATITFSGGDAAIVFQGSYSHNILRYNGSANGSGLFSCYASGNNQKAVQIYYREGQTIVARPTISPASGTYTEAQTVTITNNAEGATVYYTTDGTTPTTSSTVYSGPFTLTANGTYEVKAIAVVDGNSSSVATSTITIQVYVEAPTIDPADGTAITEETSISISTTASGLAIYYTTDGTDPVKNGELTSSAKAYNGAFTLSKAGTVKAVAMNSDGVFSEVVTATYTYNGTVTAPYYENFDEGLGNFTVETSGTNPPVWKFQETTNTATYGTRKYAYVNGSNKTGTARLISPVIDLTDGTITTVTLSFIHAGRYFDGYTTTNYTAEQTAAGNAPTHAQVFVREEGGEWTQVTIPNWFTQAGEGQENIYERTNSGDIDLSSFAGKKIQVSFLYTADGSNSGTNSTGIWNVLKFALTTENFEVVNMKTDGFATYVVKNDIDWKETLLRNEGVHGYKVIEFSTTSATFVEYGYGGNEEMIPAETPIIMKGKSGDNYLVIAKHDDVIDKPADNLLLPSYGDVAPTADQHLLVLQKNSAWNAESPYENYGFFKVTTGRLIPNRKAYLNGTNLSETTTSQTNPAKGIFMLEDLSKDYDIPLNIMSVDSERNGANAAVYDLSGRKVADDYNSSTSNTLQKGIYIVNGHKVVIK
ncbi:MAG: chitobiase/beta-hexosaminidase C-terminal domain-containing protein [Prevotella sp.]|nr:chitobiase/beta-hexosaminidase C-terminal domain-containing protein [Prevotella sp.]